MTWGGSPRVNPRPERAEGLRESPVSKIDFGQKVPNLTGNHRESYGKDPVIDQKRADCDFPRRWRMVAKTGGGLAAFLTAHV